MICLLAFGGISRVWLQVEQISLAYDISTSQTHIKRLRLDRQRLLTEVSALRHPNRVRKEARQLDLHRVRFDEQLYVEMKDGHETLKLHSFRPTVVARR